MKFEQKYFQNAAKRFDPVALTLHTQNWSQEDSDSTWRPMYNNTPNVLHGLLNFGKIVKLITSFSRQWYKQKPTEVTKTIPCVNLVGSFNSASPTHKMERRRRRFTDGNFIHESMQIKEIRWIIYANIQLLPLRETRDWVMDCIDNITT